jgi:hypothetical protein
MKINGGNSGPIRPDPLRGVQGPAADAPGRSDAHPSVARQDSVEISDAGRARAAGELSQAEGASRLQEIRQRILQGAYDSDAVVAEVARRILDRGDL